MTAEQWIGRLGEIVEAEEASDAEDQDEGIKAGQASEKDDDDDDDDEDSEPSDNDDDVMMDNRNDDDSDHEISDADSSAHDDAEPDSSPSPINTPTRSGNRIAINRTVTNRSTRPDIFSATVAGDMNLVRQRSSLRLSNTTLTKQGPYYGRNATINVSPNRRARARRAKRVVQEDESDDDDNDNNDTAQGIELDHEIELDHSESLLKLSHQPSFSTTDNDDNDELDILSPLPVTPATFQPVSGIRASEFHTPGNTMPVFLRLRIILHPMTPPWIIPVPAPYTLLNTVGLVREGLLMRGIGGPGFPDLVGLSGRGGLIDGGEWARLRLVGGVVAVGLEWDVR